MGLEHTSDSGLDDGRRGPVVGTCNTPDHVERTRGPRTVSPEDRWVSSFWKVLDEG